MDPLSLGGNVSSDVRALYMRTLRSVSIQGAMTLLYPRMIALHDLPETTGFPAANGRLKLPTFMRASHAYMVADGAYLLGEWVGQCSIPLEQCPERADVCISYGRDCDRMVGNGSVTTNTG